MVSLLDASVEEARAVESSVVEMSSGDGRVGGASHRLQHFLWIRLGFFVGGYSGSGQHRSPSLNPHLSFYSAVRQGPTNHIRVGRPQSGRRSKDQ